MPAARRRSVSHWLHGIPRLPARGTPQRHLRHAAPPARGTSRTRHPPYVAAAVPQAARRQLPHVTLTTPLTSTPPLTPAPHQTAGEILRGIWSQSSRQPHRPLALSV